MKIIFRHFITITLLILIPVVALSNEKESRLIIEDPEQLSDIDCVVFESIEIVNQIRMDENRKKTIEKEQWYEVTDPISYDVFLIILVVFAGSFFIVRGITTYKIYTNPDTNLKEV